MKNYKTFVNRVTECHIPPLDRILAARQQFIDECDENVLKDELLYCLTPFIDEVQDEEVSWWGLIMCSLFEIGYAYKELDKDDETVSD